MSSTNGAQPEMDVERAQSLPVERAVLGGIIKQELSPPFHGVLRDDFIRKTCNYDLFVLMEGMPVVTGPLLHDAISQAGLVNRLMREATECLDDAPRTESALLAEIATLKRWARRREYQNKANLIIELAAAGDDREILKLCEYLVEELQNPSSEDTEPLITDVCVEGVEQKPIEWLWHGRMPRGALTIYEGIEGEGKSMLLCEVAARVTRGQALPGDRPREPGSVLWFAAEDDIARVLKPRLMAAGADNRMIWAVSDPIPFDRFGIDALRERIEERQPTLVVIDPIFAFTPGDATKGAESRRITNQLKLVAEEFNLAMALVRHVGKAKGFGDPRAAGLYSIEWRAAARSVLLAGSDPDEPEVRALTQTKTNYGKLAEPIGYKILSDDTSPSGARFVWQKFTSLTARRILAAIGDDDERSERQQAEDFLKEILANGRMPAKQVRHEANQAGVAERTLKRAKASLGVVSVHEGGQFKGGDQVWYWVLPEGGQPSQEGPEEGHTVEIGPLEQNSTNKTTYDRDLTEEGQVLAYGTLQQEVGPLGPLEADELSWEASNEANE